MNCFEWQNRSSDYLDGALLGATKKEADQHLETCAQCSERLKRYRTIVSSISKQTRSELPSPIRKSPLNFPTPRLDARSRRSRWERAPWFVRTGVEGLGIAFIILFIVAMVPRVRSVYERSIERRLDALSMGDLIGSTDGEKDVAASIPVAIAGKTVAQADPEEEGDFEGDEEEEDQPKKGKKQAETRVGNSEIWRYNIKTDSPDDVRPRIVQILIDLGVKQDTPGIGGVLVPGGIQFDIVVSQGIVIPLRNQLQRLVSTPAKQGGLRNSSQSEFAIEEFFTWYKNKERRGRLAPGKARVVIWLAQQM
jgi:hypothetical protein